MCETTASHPELTGSCIRCCAARRADSAASAKETATFKAWASGRSARVTSSDTRRAAIGWRPSRCDAEACKPARRAGDLVSAQTQRVSSAAAEDAAACSSDVGYELEAPVLNGNVTRDGRDPAIRMHVSSTGAPPAERSAACRPALATSVPTTVAVLGVSDGAAPAVHPAGCRAASF